MSTTLLVEAKREYTEQLVLFLRDAMYDDFYVLWKESIESPDPMMNFQEKLEDIVDWDEKTMIQKTDKCISKTGCKFLDDLIVAVFVAHMKILMSIKNDKTKEQYKLQVPTTNKFVYECLLQCSREFWKSPYLFYQNELENKIKKVQIQKNLRQAEDIISSTIKTTIRAMLPVKEIVGDVFEYDKDGDLVLDIKRTDIRSQPKEETSSSTTDNSTPSLSPSPTTHLPGGSETIITSDQPVLKDSVNSSPDASDKSGGEQEGDKENKDVKEDVKEVKEDVKEVKEDVEDVKEDVKEDKDIEDRDNKEDNKDEPDILKETIENIRVFNSSIEDKSSNWEYDPFKNKDTYGDSESKDDGKLDTEHNNVDNDDDSVVDWNKGFVMGPVEEDLAIDVETIEKSSNNEVDMSDVVELQ